jgi:hypothetical protein
MNMLEALARVQAESRLKAAKNHTKSTGKKILSADLISTGSASITDTPGGRATSGLASNAGHHENGQAEDQARADLVSKSLRLQKSHRPKIFGTLQTIIETPAWRKLDPVQLHVRVFLYQLALRGMEKDRASEAKQDGRSPSQCSEAQPKIIPITINLGHAAQVKIKAGGIAAFCSKLTEQVEKALGYSLPLWLSVEDAGRVHFHGEVLANEAELEAFRAVVHKLSKVSLKTFRNRVLVSSERRRQELLPLLGPRLATLFWGSYSLKDTPDIPGSRLYVSRQITQQARVLYPSLRSRLIKHLLDLEERRQDEERAMVELEDRLAEEHQHALEDEYDARYSAEVDHDPSRIAAKISRITALIAAPKNKVSLSRELPSSRPRPKPLLERINQAREQRRIQDEEARREWNQFKPLLAGLW